ncbi:MAG: polysaccharide deacetylase family protein [Candidatus Peribacteraceae bacterium]|nr:polysaccharide deacetylase family protein [Candidatus Peribacteraceae bacterium]
MKTYLFTVDVEEQSLIKNRLDDDVPNQLLETGMPRVLDLLEKHQIKATFYYTGTIAESHPELVKMALDKGHEIGCHGYDHSPNRAFDVLTYEEQVTDIRKAIQAIESAGHRPTAFRAPAARMGKDTMKVLEKFDFTTDSSISPQRFDGPMSFGSKRKMKWLFAPRGPYHPDVDSIFNRGTSSILEIPLTSLVIPYIGTLMRISPRTFRLLESVITMEVGNSDMPVVFVFHPNECIDKGIMERNRRSDSTIEHIFGDIIRQELKVKNLGMSAITLVDDMFNRIKRKGFEFMTVTEFATKYGSLYDTGELQ